MNLRNNSIKNHINTVAGEELQELPKIGLEKLELDELDKVGGGFTSASPLFSLGGVIGGAGMRRRRSSGNIWMLRIAQTSVGVEIDEDAVIFM